MMTSGGAPRTAIILAAGRGVRLGRLTAERPKCLIEVGAKSLLAHSLDHLERAGLREAIVVTGHAAAVLGEALDNWTGGMRIVALPTPDYETRGSMGSLLTAIECTGTRSALLLESDLLYHPDFLAAALSSESSTILTADVSGSGDEVYVRADDDGRLEFLGKTGGASRPAASVGEFAGISLLREPIPAMYAERARAWLAAGRIDAHYEEVLLDLARDGNPIQVRHCPSLPWTEVDNLDDLHRAEKLVWPRLLAAD